MYVRKMICLANSRKPPSGRCIAGKEHGGPRNGQWLRPVSARTTREISEEERRYENGSRAHVLDIISVPLAEASAAGHQTENHVIADDHYWVREGRATWDQVQAAVDPYDAAFWGQGESTYHGQNDKLSTQALGGIHTSLKLIPVPEMRVLVRLETGYGQQPARRRVRGQFQYHGRQYMLSITHPEIEDQYLQAGNGEYEIHDTVLCVSLSEVIYGYAFRLIAAVFTEETCGA